MRLTVLIKPNSAKGPLVELQQDGSLVVYVREVPEKGRANDALIKLLADHLDLPKSCVSIASGHTSRHKIIEIDI